MEKTLKVGQASLVVLKFIVDFKEAHDGCSPSVRDIVAACDYSTESVASYHLKRLESAGLIKRFGNRDTARNIMVVGGCWKMGEKIDVEARG